MTISITFGQIKDTLLQNLAENHLLPGNSDTDREYKNLENLSTFHLNTI
jgi:hypothetical protein